MAAKSSSVVSRPLPKSARTFCVVVVDVGDALPVVRYEDVCEALWKASAKGLPVDEDDHAVYAVVAVDGPHGAGTYPIQKWSPTWVGRRAHVLASPLEPYHGAPRGHMVEENAGNRDSKDPHPDSHRFDKQAVCNDVLHHTTWGGDQFLVGTCTTDLETGLG